MASGEGRNGKEWEGMGRNGKECEGMGGGKRREGEVRRRGEELSKESRVDERRGEERRGEERKEKKRKEERRREERRGVGRGEWSKEARIGE